MYMRATVIELLTACHTIERVTPSRSHQNQSDFEVIVVQFLYEIGQIRPAARSVIGKVAVPLHVIDITRLHVLLCQRIRIMLVKIYSKIPSVAGKYKPNHP